jgi:hypothetical protein
MSNWIWKDNTQSLVGKKGEMLADIMGLMDKEEYSHAVYDRCHDKITWEKLSWTSQVLNTIEVESPMDSLSVRRLAQRWAKKGNEIPKVRNKQTGNMEYISSSGRNTLCQGCLDSISRKTVAVCTNAPHPRLNYPEIKFLHVSLECHN